jgi:hypothetical protein
MRGTRAENVGQKGAESAKCVFWGKMNGLQLLHFQRLKNSSFTCFVCNTSFTFDRNMGEQKAKSDNKGQSEGLAKSGSGLSVFPSSFNSNRPIDDTEKCGLRGRRSRQLSVISRHNCPVIGLEFRSNLL